MSEPTYRIDIEFDPRTDTRYVWNFFVRRVSDDSIVADGFAVTKQEARREALAATFRVANHQGGEDETLYADEDGKEIVPEPQSLRA